MSDIKIYHKVKRNGGIKCNSSSTHFHPRKWHQVPHSLGRWPGIEGMGKEKNSWQPEQSERIHRLQDASYFCRRNELTESITLFALPWEFLPTEIGGIHSEKGINLNLSPSVTDLVNLLLVYVAQTTHLTILNFFVFNLVIS